MRLDSKEQNYSLRLFIRGGLGNQLFQFTGALFHAHRLSANLIVNDTALVNHHDFSRQNWISQLDFSHISDKTVVSWKRDRRKFFSIHKNTFMEIEEDGLMNLTAIENNLSFRGWFQSSQFPTGLKIESSAFRPKSISESVEKQTFKIKETQNLVGIHMRFGDFKSTSWGTLSADWYSKAFNELENRGITHAHIYTDEISVAKELLSGLSHKIIVDFPEAQSKLLPDELLWVMRHYETFVSSNSTLAWWASYLNINKNPIIYCPWEENLYLKPWIKIT
jgi:hypothetical protein